MTANEKELLKLEKNFFLDEQTEHEENVIL